MKIDIIVTETKNIADKYHLKFIELDRTDNIVSMRLLIEPEFFIQIYGNIYKKKISFTLVYKKKRLYGYDSAGGSYHYHPFNNPDSHLFTDDKIKLEEFVRESMKLLEENEIL